MMAVGLYDFIDKQILVLCANYFYTGKLIKIYHDSIVLKDAKIVFETGIWGDEKYKEVMPLNQNVYIQINSIESFMAGK